MKRVYEDTIVEGLKDIASYDFQKAAWFENSLGLSSSFEIDVENLFIDSGLEAAFKDNEIVFGMMADKSLLILREACDALGYEWDGKEKELLVSGEMKNIRKLAKDCLNLIRTSDISESTVELVNSGVTMLDRPFLDRDKL